MLSARRRKERRAQGLIPGSPESGSGRSLGVTRDPRSGLNQRPWVKPLLSPGQRSRDLAGGTGRRERRPQRSQGAWMGRGNGRRVNGDAAGNGRGRPSTGKRKLPCGLRALRRESAPHPPPGVKDDGRASRGRRAGTAWLSSPSPAPARSSG